MNGKRELLPDERGQSFVVMLLIIMPLLMLVLGVLFDLGNLAADTTVAQNAADLAAQEAGKMVDVDYYRQWQAVRLRPEALLVAQQVADEMTGGALVITAVYVDGSLTVVEGEITVRTPFLRLFLGRASVTRFVQAVAESAYGIERGGWGE